ncbi:hypothetical protein H2200_009298 [Cladophialophora chaetospira]|uniref:Beta-glucuronidase C-terminal domain-containing protein n=1 Tax=Cladophialophora chaetospira TaxID=386627 RepID=A0AA39CFK5_9EURO|nr:hypothetical protein H2200_009298 [Cladophialophora chaetospira]
MQLTNKGNTSSPNTFSVNLLENIEKLQGTMPVIRVGGNSQDRAIYDDSLVTATASSCSADALAIQCIGKSFFDSYGTFPRTRYSHGFNLAWNNASGYNTLAATVPLACKAIGAGKLENWEYGNEPDLYMGKWRPSNWTEAEYVAEWQNGTSQIRSLLQEACPKLASQKYFNFMAPSLSSPGSKLRPTEIFNDTLNSGHSLEQISVHNYITGATSPGVTLQNSLLNHSSTVASLNKHVATAANLSSIPDLAGVPYILGEHNSLYGGGRAGLSDVFGSALWVLDSVSYGASTEVIRRMHFHQSTTAPYAAWTPTGVNASTHPSYYGKLAAARFLGDSTTVSVSEIALPDSSPFESAYAIYDRQSRGLKRLAVINMREYNSTQSSRPVQTYSFIVAPSSSWTVERLTAPGAEVTTGVTFNGYAYESATLGLPRKIDGTVEVLSAASDGTLQFALQDSEAAILSLN